MIMNNKPTLLKLAVLLAVLFLVAPTWNHHRTVLALPVSDKRCLLDETKVALEPKDELVTSITDLTDGVYSFELSTVRTGCATSGNGRNDYLGFNNRTCTTSLTPKETAGPVMRQSNKSKQWYDWLVRVEGSEQQEDGSIEVSLQAFIDPKLAEDAYCLGFMSTFYDSPGYNAVCSLPPYGTGMFMNGSVSCPVGEETDAQKWLIRPVGESGEVEILAPKPAICARAVAVKDCEYQPILVNYPVVNEANTNTYAKWKLVKRYDLVPRTVPSPPPPSPVPPPPAPIPGPIISAPPSTSSGYVNVVVNDLGGNSRCQVTSINVVAVGASVGSVPKTVEVSASTPALSTAGVPILLPYAGYNSLYAYSVCSTGEKTVMSNKLSVFYLKPGPVPTGVLFALKYQNTSADCDATDRARVCDNIMALQGGGTCSIISSCSPPAPTITYIPVGTASYQTGQEALSLAQKLQSNPSSLLNGPWGTCGGNFTVVNTVLAIADPLPTTIPDPPTVTSAAFVGNCSTTLEVKFTPPADTTGILAYAAKCTPDVITRRRGLKVPQPLPVFAFTEGAGSTSILLQGVTNIRHVCEMWSFTVGSESVPSNTATANSTCIL